MIHNSAFWVSLVGCPAILGYLGQNAWPECLASLLSGPVWSGVHQFGWWPCYLGQFGQVSTSMVGGPAIWASMVCGSTSWASLVDGPSYLGQYT
jgi:hypothetical protein